MSLGGLAPKCVYSWVVGFSFLGSFFFVKAGADSRGVLERSHSRDPLRNPCRKPFPKGPCTQIVYPLAPKYLYRDYFKAKVYTI